jgi:hypothetical protein
MVTVLYNVGLRNFIKLNVDETEQDYKRVFVVVTSARTSNPTSLKIFCLAKTLDRGDYVKYFT